MVARKYTTSRQRHRVNKCLLLERLMFHSPHCEHTNGGCSTLANHRPSVNNRVRHHGNHQKNAPLHHCQKHGMTALSRHSQATPANRINPAANTQPKLQSSSLSKRNITTASIFRNVAVNKWTIIWMQNIQYTTYELVYARCISKQNVRNLQLIVRVTQLLGYVTHVTPWNIK